MNPKTSDKRGKPEKPDLATPASATSPSYENARSRCAFPQTHRSLPAFCIVRPSTHSIPFARYTSLHARPVQLSQRRFPFQRIVSKSGSAARRDAQNQKCTRNAAVSSILLTFPLNRTVVHPSIVQDVARKTSLREALRPTATHLKDSAAPVFLHNLRPKSTKRNH